MVVFQFVTLVYQRVMANAAVYFKMPSLPIKPEDSAL
jgi:hypothetical protein